MGQQFIYLTANPALPSNKRRPRCNQVNGYLDTHVSEGYASQRGVANLTKGVQVDDVKVGTDSGDRAGDGGN